VWAATPARAPLNELQESCKPGLSFDHLSSSKKNGTFFPFLLPSLSPMKIQGIVSFSNAVVP